MNLFNEANPDELMYKLRSQEKLNHYSNDQTILFQEALRKTLEFSIWQLYFYLYFCRTARVLLIAKQSSIYLIQNIRDSKISQC